MVSVAKSSSAPIPPAKTLPAPVLADRLAAVVRRHGVGRVARITGLGPETVLRVSLGLPTHFGSRLVTERHLPELEALR